MTRFLSESLQAPEPFFRLGLRQLEAANGNPSTDIRFTSKVLHETKQKLMELGLDPRDTTPQELYHALQSRLKLDDAALTRFLQTKAALHISAEAAVVDGMVHVLQNSSDAKQCFALKLSVARTLIRQLPPKKAMKELGYRSLDSCIKHEHPISIMAAAWLTETATWQRRFIEQYKKLQPSDFESRPIQLIQLKSKRWNSLATTAFHEKRHNLLCFKELGALAFLPLSSAAPAGSVTVSMSLALHEINEIRAASTFLKLHQVQNDFGATVQMVATSEPRLSSQILDKPVPWRLIQQYYARLTDRFREDVFEPHIQLDDMLWQPVEHTLASLVPRFSFWQNSHYLGLLHERQPVSLNIMDVALNYCNQLSFDERVAHYFQRSLWHELLLRYLKHGPVEAAVLAELQPEYGDARALA